MILAVAATAGCAPPKPASCDATCAEQEAEEMERQQLQEAQARERERSTAQAQAMAQELERSSRELAEAQAQAARAEASALQQLNEARATVGLPPLSHWSSGPGGLTPNGALLLFGGRDHKTYLGCLCDATEPDSVMSQSGQFGPNGYRMESIWSQIGDYGSSYGAFSPCNRFADHPPVVVSKEGAFYGYLTIDRFKDKAVTAQAVLSWLETVCNR
jgi:hypothetical protein